MTKKTEEEISKLERRLCSLASEARRHSLKARKEGNREEEEYYKGKADAFFTMGLVFEVTQMSRKKEWWRLRR